MAMTARAWVSFLSMATAAAALGAPSTARADDDESIPGAACQQFADNSTALFVHTVNGAGYNNTNANMAVNCPVQRDLPGSTHGVWVAVYVNNPAGKTTTCSLYSSGVDLANVDSETISTTTTGWQAMYFTNVTANASWGTLNLSCTLPAKGFIYDYYVYEYT